MRVDFEGSDNPVRSISDHSGYIYIPFFEEGKRFVATAFDRVTGQTRTFEGVGPAYRDSTHLFFNFLTEDPPELCAPPEGYNKVWRGFASNLWEEPLNWLPEGAPAPSDDVYICPDAIGQPSKADVAINVNDLFVPEGARITFDGFGGLLNVFGNLDASGGIDGSAGPVIIRGGGNHEGTVHRVEVWEPSTLSGDLTVTESISVQEPSGVIPERDGDASLRFGGHTLTTESFACCDSGAVG